MSIALLLCIGAFALCFWIGRHSLVNGLIAVFGIGYAYGIVRANLPDTFSHFIFDAGAAGLYVAQMFHRVTQSEKYRVEKLKPWLEVLIGWPLLVFLLPFQDWLIRIVGLRGSIFLLPFIVFGARLDAGDRYRMALYLAAFNVVVCVLAGFEYFNGIEAFFPRNHMTELIYRSTVMVGSTDYRIPSSFANAHAYGGTMVVTLPLLLGAVIQKDRKTFYFVLLALGIAAALLGVLMSAARVHFIAAAILTVVTTFSLRSRLTHAFGWAVLIATIGWAASGEVRLQRFVELRDTDAVIERISSSVNMGFFEIAANYPFGNGLGGGGTNIPYFLQGEIRNPVMMESEYARIMIEQGIVGLVFWGFFIGWLITRHGPGSNDSWYLGRRLARIACVILFISGMTGAGLLTSIPQTGIFLLLVGWVGAREAAEESTQTATKPVMIQTSPRALPV
jgi:hypothetical protein